MSSHPKGLRGVLFCRNKRCLLDDRSLLQPFCLPPEQTRILQFPKYTVKQTRCSQTETVYCHKQVIHLNTNCAHMEQLCQSLSKFRHSLQCPNVDPPVILSATSAVTFLSFFFLLSFGFLLFHLTFPCEM